MRRGLAALAGIAGAGQPRAGGGTGAPSPSGPRGLGGLGLPATGGLGLGGTGAVGLAGTRGLVSGGAGGPAPSTPVYVLTLYDCAGRANLLATGPAGDVATPV